MQFSDFTILMGQNNSGKSTLLEAIYNLISDHYNSNYSKCFSKVLKQNSSLTIGFQVEPEDLVVLSQLFTEQNGDYTPFIYEEIHLKCNFFYPTDQFPKGRKTEEIIPSKHLKAKYRNDTTQLRRILEELRLTLRKSILMIRTTSESFNEHFGSRLEYIEKIVPDINKIIRNLFDDVKLELIRTRTDQLATRIAQSFRGIAYNSEIDEMGEGFRKALSMITEICMSNPKIILIDEPDSSMHAKLIKDLSKYLRNLNKQILISTHSDIFMNEFEKSNLRYIYSKSSLFSTIEDLRKVDRGQIFADLGVLNTHYIRSSLFSSQLVLLVEGENDVKYIKMLLKKIGLDKQIEGYRYEFITTGGNVIPKIDMIDRINNTTTPILIIRDRDENDGRYVYKHKEKLGDRIHFWKRREIENYFFSYDSFYESIIVKLNQRGKFEYSITKDEVKDKIMELAQGLVTKTALMNIYQKYKLLPLVTDRENLRAFLDEKINTLQEDRVLPIFYDNFFQEINDTIKRDKILKEFTQEKGFLSSSWKNEQSVLETCLGKDLLEKINNWLRKRFQIEIDVETLYRNLKTDQVDSDIHDLVYKIIKLCKCEKYKYLKHYDFRINIYIDETYKSLYLNKNYYTSCPTINSSDSILYVDGTMENSLKDRVIAIFSLQGKAVISTIPIDQDIIISNMVYDPASRLLFAAAGITRNNRTIDTVLIINPESRRICKRIPLYDEYYEDKEGGLGKLLVNPINNHQGVIYAASVYSHGGNKVLYIITYVIEDSKINYRVEKELVIGRYGPIALTIDKNQKKVYALSNDDQVSGSSIYVIDSESNNIINKILIPGITSSISPYRGNIMAPGYNNMNLLVVLDNKLFVIDTLKKEILKRLKNFRYQNIISSNDGKNIYVVTS
jgi:predicted ATP-dependent endonuclease of OLD family